MPNIKEYKHDPGYYIHARPPDTGNINYQIEPEAYPIIEDYGLTHEDEITWGMIRSMKSLGFIYTEKSGTLDVGEFEPDPEKLEQMSLSEQQANDFVGTIQEHYDLTSDQLETICSILGVDTLGPDINPFEDNLKDSIARLVDLDHFPLTNTVEDADHDEITTRLRTSDYQEENRMITICVILSTSRSAPIAASGPTILGGVPDGDYLLPTGGGICHNISVSSEEGIADWVVGIDREISWLVRAETNRQIGHLLPVIVEQLEKAGIDPGSPNSIPEPVFDDYNI